MSNYPWSLVSPHGILVDEAQDAWWSGHVTDILELDGGQAGLLIATEMGGVWTVSVNNMAIPLSDSWDNPKVNRLAVGPDGDRHFFAACDAGVIYESDISQPVPLLSWKPVMNPLPPGVGNVRGLCVIRKHRIILAGTDGGLYWSYIPVPEKRRGCLGVLVPISSSSKFYEWKKAYEPNLGQGGYYDITIGSRTGNTDVPGHEALDQVTVVAGGKSAGVFVGSFRDSNTLVLERGRILDDQDRDLTDWWFLSTGYSSVANCERYSNNLYAACAYADGRFKMVLRSKDGGRNWRITGFDLKNVSGQSDLRAVAGEQGNGWNNAIGVLKTGPGVVAIGWQAGTFISPDAGNTWIALSSSPHLHADVHVVRFRDTAPDDTHQLLIGSDGGIAEVSVDDAFKFKTTGRSDFNRNLPTLQCYGTWPIPRQFYGSLASSSWGFVATGVQDNGNIYLDTTTGQPWRMMDGGDGGWIGFVEDSSVVRNIMGSAVTAGRRQGSLISGNTIVRVASPLLGNPNGLIGPVADVVRMPTYKNAEGHLMLAVAGSGVNIYGLFPDRNREGTFRWERIGELPASSPISALASHRGNIVHMGTADGRFFELDTAQGTLLELSIKLPKTTALKPHTGGVPCRIVTLSTNDTFAILNGTTEGMNYVLRLSGLTWRPPGLWGLPTTEPLYGIDGALVEDRKVLFVSTDDKVYVSQDGGESWVPETMNLPRRPHGADIRVSITQRGGAVFLGTFGRSVYRTILGGAYWGS